MSEAIGDGEMKVLVVYGTSSGCTTGVAEKIGERLTELGATVDVVSAEKAGDPSEYDAVIVGSGVRAGSWHSAAKKWAEAHATALKARPVALFTVGLTPQDPSKNDEVKRYTDALLQATGIEPVDIGVFAGWNEPKAFSFVERTVLKMMKAPVGDFRDMKAIAGWAESVLPKLGRA